MNSTLKMMKTSLSFPFLLWMLLIALIGTKAYAQEQRLFYCVKDKNLKNIRIIDQQSIARAYGSDNLILLDESNLPLDTLYASTEWGPLMGISIIDSSQVAITYMRHGLNAEIRDNSFRITKEIGNANMLYNQPLATGTVLGDYLFGFTWLETKRKDAPNNLFSVLCLDDTVFINLESYGEVKSRYYQGMVPINEYFLIDSLVVMNHPEINKIIIFNVKTRKHTIRDLPEIKSVKNEAWGFIYDYKTKDCYLLNTIKDNGTKVYSYSLKNHQYTYLFQVDAKLDFVNDNRFFFKKFDSTKDYCYYYVSKNE